MRFEWDRDKAASNLLKHGVGFEEAATAFDDPDHFIKQDRDHSTENEIRMWLIGRSALETVVLVVFTIRENGAVYRLISARKANREERTNYERLKNARP